MLGCCVSVLLYTSFPIVMATVVFFDQMLLRHSALRERELLLGQLIPQVLGLTLYRLSSTYNSEPELKVPCSY